VPLTARKLADFATTYARQPGRARSDYVRWRRDRRLPTLVARRPWWPYVAVEAVEAALPARARVVEYGGGGSTLWLLDRGATVVCIEHDRDWAATLTEEADGRAELRLVEPSTSGEVSSGGLFYDDYVTAVADLPDGSQDLVIVDGRARVACGLAAMSKVRPGGMLLLDDSDRARYEGLREALAGWRGQDYRGLKLGGGPVFQTSVWTRPN
jgi:hypothetical protein